MKLKVIALGLVAAFLPWASQAQDRLTRKVVVDLPNDVTVNEQVIPAGHYELRQLNNPAGGAQVLFITEEGAVNFRAAVTTIPAVANNTPEKTQVIVRRVGRTYYLDKVWIEGRDYGYEFELPGYARALLDRNNTEASALRLDYKPAPAPLAADVQTSPSTTSSTSTTTSSTAANTETTPSPQPAPREEPAVVAQAQTPTPTPTPTPAPTQTTAPPANDQSSTSTSTAQSTTPAPSTTTQSTTSTNAQNRSSDATLPATASGIFGVGVLGLALLGSASFLRWWRSAN